MVQWDPSHQNSRRMKQREGTEGMVPVLPQWGLVLEGVFGFWGPEQLDQVCGTLDHPGRL